ncbi:MAG: DPP IV N-terminal domain-containing protein, partial [Gemmatimonadales bacterium]
NDTEDFTNIVVGRHYLELTDIADNCSVSGYNPRAIDVDTSLTAEVTYNVICSALTGSLAVTTVTDGDTLDPDGYTITVDGAQSRAIDANEVLTIPNVPKGSHTIELTGIARNCTALDPNPRDISITVGGTTHETFHITCAPALLDRITYVRGDPAYYRAYVMQPDGSNVTQITTHSAKNHYPQVSPDGTKILFTSDSDGDDAIYVMDVAGTNLLKLTNSPESELMGSWSPDGSMIAFVGEESGNKDIYVINSTGGEPQRLTWHAAWDGWPTWSPDGKKIAFASYRDSRHQIYVMDPDGSNLNRLTNSDDEDFGPTWSPDGTKIAFTKLPQDANADIYVMNADGSDVRRLTDNPAYDGNCDWSPGGGRIAFISARDGYHEVYVMHSSGSSQTRITSVASFHDWPRWTPAR